MKFLSLIRAAVLNFVIPLVLAWALIGYVDRHYFPAASVSFYRGLIKLRVKLPGTAAGIEEPLLTVGKPGNATFVYIRILRHSQARVGIEFWGYGAMESDPFPLSSQDAEINVVASFPALYRELGDGDWGSVSEAEQRRLLSHYSISVDGTRRLGGSVDYKQPPGTRYYLGANPLGGSLVSDFFTGKIVSWSRPNTQ